MGRARDIAQVVEHMHSVHEGLGTTPSSAKAKQKKRMQTNKNKD
jgi:hypothetical protein